MSTESESGKFSISNQIIANDWICVFLFFIIFKYCTVHEIYHRTGQLLKNIQNSPLSVERFVRSSLKVAKVNADGDCGFSAISFLMRNIWKSPILNENADLRKKLSEVLSLFFSAMDERKQFFFDPSWLYYDLFLNLCSKIKLEEDRIFNEVERVELSKFVATDILQLEKGTDTSNYQADAAVFNLMIMAGIFDSIILVAPLKVGGFSVLAVESPRLPDRNQSIPRTVILFYKKNQGEHFDLVVPNEVQVDMLYQINLIDLTKDEDNAYAIVYAPNIRQYQVCDYLAKVKCSYCLG